MRRGRRGTSSTSRQVRATVIGRSTSSTSHLPDGVPGSSRLTQTFNLSQIQERENSVPELNARLLRGKYTLLCYFLAANALQISPVLNVRSMMYLWKINGFHKILNPS